MTLSRGATQLTRASHGRVPKSSYYDRNFRQGPALIRARKPYLLKNALTGLGLWCVVGGVCMGASASTL